jgi:hypothetical protein
MQEEPRQQVATEKVEQQVLILDDTYELVEIIFEREDLPDNNCFVFKATETG